MPLQTLHIQLETDEFQELETRAAALGVPVERAAADTLRRDLSGFGAAAHLAPRAADVNRDRSEEAEREEIEHEEIEREAAPVAFSTDRQTRNAQIRALLHAPADVRAATLARGSAALADDYAHDPEVTEFTRALAGEDFHDAD